MSTEESKLAHTGFTPLHPSDVTAQPDKRVVTRYAGPILTELCDRDGLAAILAGIQSAAELTGLLDVTVILDHWQAGGAPVDDLPPGWSMAHWVVSGRAPDASWPGGVYTEVDGSDVAADPYDRD